MAKNKRIPKTNPEIKPMTEEERKSAFRVFGLFLGLAAKVLLEKGDCEVNFKINGEDITDIEKLSGMDVQSKINLAIAEERYEDAAKLRDVMKKIMSQSDQKQINNTASKKK